jgi:hypothetical protein
LRLAITPRRLAATELEYVIAASPYKTPLRGFSSRRQNGIHLVGLLFRKENYLFLSYFCFCFFEKLSLLPG